ncbi:MAG TPA: pyridoxamine 5'-phosphate oxidase family protein [Chitinophagaceae bacterium]|nr:pyridoxamine 5'-phosphate oxidase family protein [Chitinophagaceae bacterium]
MFGKLKTEEIDQLISNQLIGRIGCHANGITYIVPVSYAYDPPYIYVHTYKGMKMDMMRQNPDVCFQVDDTRSLAYWQSAICWGKFEELNEPTSKTQALQKLQARILPVLSSETMHLSKEWPFPSGENERADGHFFRIRLTEKTGRFEKITGEEFYAT